MSDEQTRSTATAPPAWYPDGTGGQRWWNGDGWTDHHATRAPAGVMPIPTSRPAVPGAAEAARGGRGINALAVLALVVGVVPGIGVAGLALGVTALHQIRSSGGIGRIPAIIGITFGSLWGLGILLRLANGELGI